MSDSTLIRSTSQNRNGEDAGSFGGHLPTHKELVESKEAQSLRRLSCLIDRYAPHLRNSFVCSDNWWKLHHALPEAHMFKYLLFRGMADILVIFNDAEAEEPPVIRSKLEEANAKAAPVWASDKLPFTMRLAECNKILNPVIDLNMQKEVGEYWPVPRPIAKKLDKTFREFYGTPDKLQLIGQTHDQAYKVQEEYSHAVENLLKAVSPSVESRAITRLGKIYGRSSIPLLCMSSVSGLWKLCQSSFYRRVISLLYKWIQPFAEIPRMHRLGCDYISSIHRFVRPKPGQKNDLFKDFYASVMVWSTSLYFVALLDMYAAPKPVVADYVRQQLFRNEEDEKISNAIRDKQEGRSRSFCLYSTWLEHSGLDFSTQDEALAQAIDSRLLTHSLFDLTLGHRAKSFILNHYEEIHHVRRIIASFFEKHGNQMSQTTDLTRLWSDGVIAYRTAFRPWISTKLREDCAFLSIFESWLGDGECLQVWLQNFEAEMQLVNNPKAVDRVFSESTATAALDWAKFQGAFFDRRRRRAFKDQPGWFIDECEGLGLFTTRMPRFSQLFFYEFTDCEVDHEAGQPTSSLVSKRAAEAYLRSGVRLESTCGISDIWYRYVEANRGRFETKTTPSPPLEQTPHPRPRIDHFHAMAMWNDFQWAKQHSQLLPPQERAVDKGTDHNSQPGEPMDRTKTKQDGCDDYEFDDFPADVTFGVALDEAFREAERAYETIGKKGKPL